MYVHTEIIKSDELVWCRGEGNSSWLSPFYHFTALLYVGERCQVGEGGRSPAGKT